MKKTKILNRDTIKYIAIVLMLLDHIIQVFPICDGLLYTILDSLTHFTFITMAYFLVEGFYYTSNRARYLKRLLIFGLIAELPYLLAFTKGSVIRFVGLDVFFSLAFGLLMIMSIDSTDDKKMKVLYAIAGVLATTICDWTFFAGIFILSFYLSYGNRKRLFTAYVVDIIVYLGFKIFEVGSSFLDGQTYVSILVESIGLILSMICIMYFYNGKKSTRCEKLNKWFFYIFYPGHLLIIAVIRICLLL